MAAKCRVHHFLLVSFDSCRDPAQQLGNNPKGGNGMFDQEQLGKIAGAVKEVAA